MPLIFGSLDIVGKDPDYKTMLVALDLAHRWQVQNVVLFLGKFPTGSIELYGSYIDPKVMIW